MIKSKQGAREKILQAAEELARETGPGNISLDAVAARAGVSKGGLLYHFPSKAKLLEAVVEDFLGELDHELQQRERENTPNSVVNAYLDIFIEEHCRKSPPPSGLLAAMAENPEFLDPVRRFQRVFLDRIRATSSDPTTATIVFLALQGIRSMELLNMETIHPEEFEAAVARMRDLVRGEA